jgi:hypothetical protein
MLSLNPLDPQNIATETSIVVTTLTEIIIQKDPTTLPGFQALGPALVGVAAGTTPPTGLEAPVELLLTELNLFNAKAGNPLSFFVNAVLSQLNLDAALNKAVPSLQTGVVNTILTVAGNAIITATANYVANNPAPVVAATPAAK